MPAMYRGAMPDHLRLALRFTRATPKGRGTTTPRLELDARTPGEAATPAGDRVNDHYMRLAQGATEPESEWVDARDFGSSY